MQSRNVVYIIFSVLLNWSKTLILKTCLVCKRFYMCIFVSIRNKAHKCPKYIILTKIYSVPSPKIAVLKHPLFSYRFKYTTKIKICESFIFTVNRKVRSITFLVDLYLKCKLVFKFIKKNIGLKSWLTYNTNNTNQICFI